MRFDRRAGERVETIGYRLIWKDSVEHRDSLFTPFTPLACAMLHREIIERLGHYEDSMVADIELLMRISRHYDYVHVDQPCIEIEYDPASGGGTLSGFGARAQALERVYERYPSESADVAAGRKAKIAWHHERAESGSYFAPEMVLAQPELRS
jgi:hypothetical protein